MTRSFLVGTPYVATHVAPRTPSHQITLENTREYNATWNSTSAAQMQEMPVSSMSIAVSRLDPPRCHHPLRMGSRLYWHHGLFILDISDMARPKLVAHANTSPAFA